MHEKVSERKKWWSFATERPDFGKLWSAQSISVAGSQVTLIAFPLTAIAVLNASASEVGILSALGRAPFLLFGLFAGVLIERWRSRRVLIITNWISAAGLALIPIAAFSDILSIEWLFVIGFALGSCTVFFDIAYQSALTSLVRRDDLLTANRWLETSRSVADMSGPGLAAVLLKVVSAPVAIAVDALSFALSALFVHGIRTVETKPSKAGHASIWTDFRTGLRFIFETPFLRWNALIAGTWNLMHNGLLAIFFVYLVRDLNLGAVAIAIVVFVGSLGSFLGVMIVSRVNRWFGVGWCIVIAMCTGSLGGLLLAAAGGSSAVTIIVVTAGFSLINAAEPLFNVNAISIRQMITPAHLMARTTGAIRFLVWGTLPIGALIAGFLGDALGGRATMVVIGIGFLLPAIMTLLSPFRHARTVSDMETGNSKQKSKEGSLDA